MNFKKEDIITGESYKPLCDYIYSIGDDVPEGLVHVNMEELPEFIQAITKFPERKYIVISSASDYGVVYQKRSPPWKDLAKWSHMICRPKIGYNGITIHPRLNIDKCCETDEYSIKCYAYTMATFPHIPNNICKWFMTNASIYHDKVVPIPGGVPSWSTELFPNTEKPKRNLLYINLQNTTNERVDYVKNFIALNDKNEIVTPSWVTYVHKPVEYSQYLKDLSEHIFILSPPGNGIDCYRTLESIYCGAIPIVDDNPTTRSWGNIDMLVCPNFNIITRDKLEEIIPRFGFSNEIAKLGFWKNIIEEERKKVGI